MSFEITDLGMSDDALSQITEQLANSSNPDPISDAIARQTQTVTDYTIRYVISQERQYRLIRSLVLFDLYSNPAMGAMPPQVQTTFTAAMKELTDIRDGKFPDLALLHPPDGSEAPTSDSAAWGSDRKVNMRRDGFGSWGCE